MTYPQHPTAQLRRARKAFGGHYPYGVAYAATSTSLFGDETRANHLTSQLLRFFGTVAEVSNLSSTRQSW